MKSAFNAGECHVNFKDMSSHLKVSHQHSTKQAAAGLVTPEWPRPAALRCLLLLDPLITYQGCVLECHRMQALPPLRRSLTCCNADCCPPQL